MNDDTATTPTDQQSGPAGPAVFATLQARDAGALITHLTEVFGFVQTIRVDDGDSVAHAELRWPEGPGGVMLGTHRPRAEWSREPGTAGTYVVTSDIDALYARATSRGADIVQELADTDYDSREFTARDPEGNLWSFGVYAGAPLPRR